MERMDCRGRERTPGSAKMLMRPGQRGLQGMGGTAGLGWRDPHLLLQVGRLEGEQELLDVVLAELVDAAGVNGPAQELIHLILGVEGLLGATAGEQGWVRNPPRPLALPQGGAGCDPPGTPAWGHLLVLAGVIDALGRHKAEGGCQTSAWMGGTLIDDKHTGHRPGSPRPPRMQDRVPRVTGMGRDPQGFPKPGKDGGGCKRRVEGGV